MIVVGAPGHCVRVEGIFGPQWWSHYGRIVHKQVRSRLH